MNCTLLKSPAMVKNYFSLVFFFFFLTNIYSQTTTIPDANFEQFLIDELIDSDGVINQSVATADISMVPYLDVSAKNIIDLTGIEDFTSLEYLDCSDNQIESLDVSQNTLLDNLWCGANQLTGLDVSQNTALAGLVIYNNPLISTLDVSQNSGLTFLDCSLTGLSALDVSNNMNLTQLDCNSNQISILNVSNNLALTYLNCSANQISSLDLSNNTALTSLYAGSDQITSLDVSLNTELTALGFTNTQITSLDVSQNTELNTLWCYDNQLTTLDLSLNTNLTYVDCNTNLLESLNIKNGNNMLITNFSSYSNPSLSCIQVDNEVDANNGTAPYNSWTKDITSTYSEDCAALGIEDILLGKSVTMYPNPVTDILTINSEIALTKVEIYSTLGMKVKEISTGFNSIPTNDLSVGIYLIKIESELGFIVKKLIKKINYD